MTSLTTASGSASLICTDTSRAVKRGWRYKDAESSSTQQPPIRNPCEANSSFFSVRKTGLRILCNSFFKRTFSLLPTSDWISNDASNQPTYVNKGYQVARCGRETTIQSVMHIEAVGILTSPGVMMTVLAAKDGEYGIVVGSLTLHTEGL